jgi:hypothetical protein
MAYLECAWTELQHIVVVMISRRRFGVEALWALGRDLQRDGMRDGRASGRHIRSNTRRLRTLRTNAPLAALCTCQSPPHHVRDAGIMGFDTSVISESPQPSIYRWILGFLMVGACWGLTTPFMRAAALYVSFTKDIQYAYGCRNYVPQEHPALSDPNNSWLKQKVLGIWFAVIGVLSRPAYAVPLLLNVTGSVWFFILIGQAELSLTVPITNSLAFLFTVVGEWWAEKKVISRGKISSSINWLCVS